MTFYSRTDTKIPFGKHRGETFESIYQADPGYLRWMAQEGIVRGGINYSRLATDCLKQHEEQSEEKKTETIYLCSECGMRSSIDIFTECPFCADSLCRQCMALHNTMHRTARAQAQARAHNTEYQYAHRREYGTSKEDVEDFLNRMFGQQQQRQQNQAQQKPPQTITEAFVILSLGQQATSQEVKRKFWAMAKQGEYKHPDVGGEESRFKILNAAYEIAFSHAKRNGR